MGSGAGKLVAVNGILGEGKTGVPRENEKEENKQHAQPRCDAESAYQTRASVDTLVEGECLLLRHPCSLLHVLCFLFPVDRNFTMRMFCLC